jgi:hypothetical protein
MAHRDEYNSWFYENRAFTLKELVTGPATSSISLAIHSRALASIIGHFTLAVRRHDAEKYAPPCDSCATSDFSTGPGLPGCVQFGDSYKKIEGQPCTECARRGKECSFTKTGILASFHDVRFTSDADWSLTVLPCASRKTTYSKVSTRSMTAAATKTAASRPLEVDARDTAASWRPGARTTSLNGRKRPITPQRPGILTPPATGQTKRARISRFSSPRILSRTPTPTPLMSPLPSLSPSPPSPLVRLSPSPPLSALPPMTLVSNPTPAAASAPSTLAPCPVAHKFALWSEYMTWVNSGEQKEVRV